ncbi:MAG: 23S rRNA (adenine(2503)-C(2))-methyltransferase RlmN [Planctomycetaceae bacterium]|nr:23S rRNA (adenine(2503)-C(2))-methyltransferase RlmN [Planctomycetaceae bacterium]
MPASILDMSRDELRQAVTHAGFPVYRADQLADWVFVKGITDPAAMTNLPKARQSAPPSPDAAATCALGVEILSSRLVASDQDADGTTKLLIEFADGQRAETVLIPEPSRATACLSTQIGCAMGCRFCASGAGGFVRNMTAAEILQQVLHLRHALANPGAMAAPRITNVVFMGMGEPLANYAATIAAVGSLIDPDRFALSARSITISTIGPARAIRRLANENLPITLAISLHAPTDELRRSIMPAVRDSIDELMSAAEYFFQSRKREVTLEYVLIDSVNDTMLCADALANLARRVRCNVNLIALNPTDDCPYNRPTSGAVRNFAARLKNRGVNVHVRQSRGGGQSAACGQLRLRKEPQE